MANARNSRRWQGAAGEKAGAALRRGSLQIALEQANMDEGRIG